MSISICDVDCDKCELKYTCSGCAATNGRPFNGDCVIALCCHSKGRDYCSECSDMPCKLKEKLITELNQLGIEDMEEVTSLNALKGSYINLEYTLSSGQVVKFLDDNKIYLGNQMCKIGSRRCYGIAADEKNLMVCEYGEGGCNAEVVVFKRWNNNGFYF
ncbi:DUF3795 domain-containing protein [Bacillus sp. AGMB 02131]|uniref:DUF3795 domain-containing protein n=1 Tax=Peribacillus faecalis TaxID=2772559 RepID=A0A927CVA5_9BACI|nr:DUF3795 domain-containing protein [Peribacillus faecalis]MBD3108453.1 DUF3795 domain-containing protein [Peribacillus faecalis]